MEHWHLELIGYVGTAFTVASYGMRTIVPLRVAGILSSITFIWYGWAIQSWPIVWTELIILPLNVVRLYQVIRLIRQVEAATDSELSADWLMPFAQDRRYRAGETVFRAGDAADYLLLVRSGSFLLVEGDITLGASEIVGEMGFLTPGNTRTMSLVCVADGVAGKVSYFDLKQLYFSNPTFAFSLLTLVSHRLLENVERARRAEQAG